MAPLVYSRSEIALFKRELDQLNPAATPLSTNDQTKEVWVQEVFLPQTLTTGNF